MTEMQVFLLLLARNGPQGTLYVGADTTLSDTVEVARGRTALRDPRRGEDLRSVTRKLARMVDRGWLVSHKENFYRITDAGLRALQSLKAQDVARLMVARYAARQREWNDEAGRCPECGQRGEHACPSDDDPSEREILGDVGDR